MCIDGEEQPTVIDDRAHYHRLSKADALNRAMAMKAMYEHPVRPRSLQEIGALYNLSRERIRQIFVEYNIHTRGHGETRSLKASLGVKYPRSRKQRDITKTVVSDTDR